MPSKKSYRGLAQTEARLAFFMLIPAFTIVALVILFPVIANFWISFRRIGLGDLRVPTAVVREQVTQAPRRPGEELVLSYRTRNSSRDQSLSRVMITGFLSPGMIPHELPTGWEVRDNRLVGNFETWDPGKSIDFEFTFHVTDDFFADSVDQRQPTRPSVRSSAPNSLFQSQATLENFRMVITAREFFQNMIVSIVYPLFGAMGSIILGILSAQLLHRKFKGQGILRGLFLFPYVAPVIAVAFAWVFFLDPFSGTVNVYAMTAGIINEPISFLSARNAQISLFGVQLSIPLALTMVIIFDAWRYFPFAFLFVLARFQAIPETIYESADVDGAGPFRKFFSITLPQLRSVISTLFLLRFMWTFNKFDDIFLLTGGSAGTRTLPILVYDNAFARADIGAGAAAAVILFAMLAVLMLIYFRLVKETDDE
jgi:multiple sugar transport system permease protein